MVMRIRVTPALVNCPSCGYKDLAWNHNDHPEVFEYRARCFRCGWKGLFRELHCEKCSRARITVDSPEDSGMKLTMRRHSQEFENTILRYREKNTEFNEQMNVLTSRRKRLMKQLFPS